MVKCQFGERVSAQRAGSRPASLRPAPQPRRDLDWAPRYLSPESYAITDVSSLWADIEADPAVEAQSSRFVGQRCWLLPALSRLSPASSCKRSSFYLWGWRAVAKLVASCSASTRASSAPCFAPSLPQSHSSC
ncbi:uncharacterized protein LOC129535143 isoform X3 [Moschus berezovskii]|uniref:uncharacterized protein LOC129535143 isoform X3 n=1 Tax=Moschus berezovskii TaxID=68408 RepID=UPI002443C6BE|nr:uncharacterized protein LOC129535143 isoform X3 [Moschus berezovskii]